MSYHGRVKSNKLEELLEYARRELTLLYEIGNALRTTLDFDETLYIILTGVTAHAGLGFNRAAVFLVDKDHKQMVGRMGIGPETREEAQVIWEGIQNKHMGLQDLIANYRSQQSLSAAAFHRMVTGLKIPLTERAGGALAMTALEGAPLEMLSPEAQAQAAEDPVLRVLKSTCCVLVPLKGRDGSVVGVIFADNRITLKTISRESFRLLALLAAHAGLAIENAKSYEEALQQADLDSLTQLWNRGAFQRRFMEAVTQAEQTRQPASLLLADLDHFKEYNDQAGHLSGDQALNAVARLLKETARSGDHVCRFGGEEFALILPNTSKLNALKLAERVRLAMDRMDPPLTISVGVATFPQDASGWKEMIEKADRALYEAKRLGRNRVVIAEETG